MFWLMQDIVEEFRVYQRKLRTVRSPTEAITRCKNIEGSYVVGASNKMMFHNIKPGTPMYVHDLYINTMRTE